MQPWVLRGHVITGGFCAGVFTFSNYSGSVYENVGFRVVHYAIKRKR